MAKEAVKIWEQDIEIPTYEVGEADKNPMFLEKRVYQGSSGRVYPYPVVNKIYDEKKNKVYHAVFLENEYLQVMVLPELGGRIQRALDKTNNYDFVYYNHVIKPALVGLVGPWISGGIEFNWPQHHRPNTFGPVEHHIQENQDGSKTLWVSEVDRMYGTKGMAGFTLYPGKAYIEITGQLYNGTPEAQTFLWWANPAVPANQHTQSIFPPDVHAVFDHGKRDVSKFPIATGTYYKMDYSAGVDISRFKNIPVPTSYMAQMSKYDFVGGYDHAKQAGILHVADHHVSPGKKQWTWGCGDFGKAWDRNLTDEDGSYIELMTGVFTDNQPDFTWLQPYEEKKFKQYFMPYKALGQIKNANVNAALSLEVEAGQCRVGLYATGTYEGVEIQLLQGSNVLGTQKADVSPVDAVFAHFKLPEELQEKDLQVRVLSAEGKEIVKYVAEEETMAPEPDPAKAIPHNPEELKNTEALYLAGRHLEQYRHATYEPEGYYLEGLKRDPEDIRLNNAYGALLFRHGSFAEAEKYLQQAVDTSTRHSPNPYDGEPLYNLGLAQEYQGKLDEAYDSFFKACWSAAWQSAAYLHIARIDCIRGDLELALEHIERSIIRNYHNMKSRLLKTMILRKLGHCGQAAELARETLGIDPLDMGACHELELLGQADNRVADRFRPEARNYIMLSVEYAAAGFYQEAMEIIHQGLAQNPVAASPMLYYYGAYYLDMQGDTEGTLGMIAQAAQADSSYCFPNSLMDMLVLENATVVEPDDAMAPYYLSNLLYDKKNYDRAISGWLKTAHLKPEFPTVWRNLALAFFNKRQDPEKAKEYMETAFRLNEKDARVFLELDQLYKKLGMAPQARLAAYEKHQDIISTRDDLYVEYITLLNIDRQFAKANELIAGHKFHPWEGGEGRITKQYAAALMGLAKADLAAGKAQAAVDKLNAALVYPENLGEGKLAGAQDNDIFYYLGCGYDMLGDKEQAESCWRVASTGLTEPASAMYYNDQPPETIYFQGLALEKLGDMDGAKGRFHKLADYGEKHFFDHVVIDYFAVSLPDFMIFDEDLDKKNRIHCSYLMALGNKGLGESKPAAASLRYVLKQEPAHQGALDLQAELHK